MKVHSLMPTINIKRICSKVAIVSCFLSLLLISPITLAQNGFEIEVPLVVNEALSGDLTATIIETLQEDNTKKTEIIVQKDRLRQLLGDFASDEQIDTWLGEYTESGVSSIGSVGSIAVSGVKTGSSNEGGSIEKNNIEQSSQETRFKGLPTASLQQLRSNGLDINFDSSLLTIVTNIQYAGERSLSLSNRRTPNLASAYPAAQISSGLNYNITNNYSHRDTPGVESGLGDTRVVVDGFTNFGGFGGWSLFYQGDYIEGDEQEFARDDVTLIHDNFANGIRYAFGDVRPSVASLQTAPNLLGFSVERNYQEINPAKNIRPSGRSTFTLDRPSRVSFEVNGIIVDTQNLDAGDYSVEDFPITFGANNVRVIVDDGFSSVEVANFNAFSDIELLAPGIVNFGISGGVQRLTGAGRSRRYTDDPVLLGFYERGFEAFTLGVQAEVSENNALIGSTAVYGSRVGIVGVEVAISRREGFDTAYSSSISYRKDLNFNSGWAVRTNLQIDVQSADFGGLTTSGASDDRMAILSSLGISKGGYSFFLNGSTTRVGDTITDTLSLGLSKTFKLFNVSADYSFSQVDDLDSFENLSISVSGRFGRGSLRGQYQSSNDEYGLIWNNPTSFEAGSGSLNRVSVLENERIRLAELQASYVGSKFIFDASHIESQSQLVGGNPTSNTNLRLAGSVGYAGGRIALGRPFNDGFIIADTHDNLRGKRVSVTRSSRDGDLITSTKHLRTALIPINSSYREQRYIVDVDDLPLGYDIGSGEIQVFPGFLAGYHYKVGSDAANTAIGNLLWPDNKPPSLIVGKLIPKNGGDVITIFTNKTGRFVAERMLPGKYEIVFNDGYDDFRSEIEIKQKNEPGLIKLGTITLEKVQP